MARATRLRVRLGMIGIHLATALMGGEPAEEYALKAAVLYNVTRFVEWPPEAFKSPSDPITICILGENPFGDALKQAVDGKTHDGRKFVVRQVPDVSKAGTCQVLFISSSEQKRFRSILTEVPSRATLTVGDTGGFTNQGGVVNLSVEGQKIRLQVNLAAANHAHIRISSRLLGLAEIVKSAGP